MSHQPVISIIMPSYGVEKYISKAIESVLSQTFQNWELLVVNDGSRDNTREIAKNYEASDSRIRVLDKENGGLSDARNFGLKFAKGKYIHFFDPDDWIESDFYERLLSEIGTADFIVCGYVVDIADKSDQIVTSYKRICKNNLQSCFKITTEFLNYFFNYAWNKLFLRSFLINNHLEYEKGLWGIEDCEFMSRLVDFKPVYVCTSHCGYHYIDRQIESLSKKYDSSLPYINLRRLKCQKKIYLSMGISNIDANIAHEKLKVTVLSFMFHLIFNERLSESLKIRYSKIKTILQMPEYNIDGYYSTSLAERLFVTLINKDMSKSIILLYHLLNLSLFKKLFKR